MQFSKIKKLNEAEELKNQGKFKEALRVITKLEKKADLPFQEKLSCQLLKSTCLNRLGQNEDALKVSEHIYQETKRLGNPLQTLDASIEIAEALLFLGRLDRSFEIIDRSENLLKTITQEPSKETMQRKASLSYLKGFFYSEKGELDLALQFLEQCLTLQEEIGNKQDIARALTQLGIRFGLKGELERAREYFEKGLALEGNGFNRNIPHLLMGIHGILGFLGESKSSLEYCKRGLAFADELNDNYLIPMFLNNMGLIFYEQNDFDLALDYIEKSLMEYEKINNISMIIIVLSSLFDLAIHINSYSRAQQYLNRMEQLKDREKSKTNDTIYRLYKVLLLKVSPKASDRVKAKELLQQFVEEEIVYWPITITAFLHLCDLLLIELRDSNNLIILDQAQSYITRIHDLAKNQHSYSLLAETLLLQAKLQLITLDLKKAQHLLVQALHICEKYGLNRLVIRVSSEQEELAKQLSIWENLKKSRISINERMDFARLDEQLLRMFQLRLFLKK